MKQNSILNKLYDFNSLDSDTIKILSSFLCLTGNITPILINDDLPLMFASYGERNVTITISVCRKYYDLSVHTEEGFKTLRVTVGEMSIHTQKDYPAYIMHKFIHDVIEQISNNTLRLGTRHGILGFSPI